MRWKKSFSGTSRERTRLEFIPANDIPFGSVFTIRNRSLTVDATAREGEGNYRWTVPSALSLMEEQKVTVSLNPSPILTSAAVSDDELVLTFHEDLDDTSTPDSGRVHG